MIRAVDLHVHLPTVEWLEGSMGPYREAAALYFRSDVHVGSVDELAVEYAQEQVFGILLAWDAQTATHRPPLPNDVVAAIVKRHPRRFAFFASVDPWKPDAVQQLDRAVTELGAIGAKFHPSLQDFYPSDERHFPLWQKAAELGIPCLFHTGTSGIGAGEPGGQGIKLDPARPIHLDVVAARFPQLPIIAAHFGWPWHLELIAMALHKTNIYIELSGWSPRYYPPELVREIGGRLSDRTLFGSDYPFIKPSRVLEEFDTLELKPEAKVKILRENAARLLKLQL
ncbi:MAG TPA: amidohydrolase family protein [Candidatus Dormibacteraeota bacterium]|nr:amidohydrolase family protein [Candidatus Dormibacteraeota bacterium]